MAYIYDLSDAWSAAGTTFTAIKMSVTDTASAAGSLLMDLQVGGSSKFSVTKAGVIGGSGYYLVTSALSQFQGKFAGATEGALGAANGAAWAVGGALGFTTASNATGVSDLKLERDAANTLAQRNGVNAQAFNLYNTYTDASNYERGFMRFVSNVLEIGFGAAGTGSTGREVKLAIGAGGAIKAGTTANLADILYATTTQFSLASNIPLLWGSATNAGAGIDTGIRRAAAAVIGITNGSTGGGSIQLQEVAAPAAPGANNVRIYAEDDGAGKTRLMALFATGAAVQIAIEP